ncbi:hypothetical protein [Paenibacillus sp. FSL E2-0201]|uniref:hypothetical protein n=1 Tax=Paenibacillus sp. FSL E2-0201 TaxID=2954726 RepID=UPI0030D7EB62
MSRISIFYCTNCNGGIGCAFRKSYNSQKTGIYAVFKLDRIEFPPYSVYIHIQLISFDSICGFHHL